jgi:hypothetical protein
MPFKSQAQRRKFAELLVDGKISNETYEEWNRETGTKKLPERVRKKPAAPQKTKTRPARPAASKRRDSRHAMVRRWLSNRGLRSRMRRIPPELLALLLKTTKPAAGIHPRSSSTHIQSTSACVTALTVIRRVTWYTHP